LKIMLDKTPLIHIVIVGDEILADPGRDKNAQFLVDTLKASGYPVHTVTVTGDSLDGIRDVLTNSAGHDDILLMTGGLGPTSDDRTVEAVALAFGRPLFQDESVLAHINELFRRRNRKMTVSNQKQAMVPEGAVVLTNDHGTAPGIKLTVEATDIYLMPGVPTEMQELFKGRILPRIRERFRPEPVETAVVRVSGISESMLFDRIGSLPGAKEAFSYFPSPKGIEIRINAGKNSPLSAMELQEKVCEILGDIVFSTRKESLEEVVGAMLAESGKTVAVAESCTGGLVADRLTDVPGSSRYLLCGVVAYSNESKVSVLGVDPSLIEAYGAVSAEVAASMAEGVRKIANADIGVSTTGIAGPGGATPDKPVGIMYTALAVDGKTETKKLQFLSNRIINKQIMSQSVLDLIRHNLKETWQKK
jgi:nicotinamide-nucleotide amidase